MHRADTYLGASPSGLPWGEDPQGACHEPSGTSCLDSQVAKLRPHLLAYFGHRFGQHLKEQRSKKMRMCGAGLQKHMQKCTLDLSICTDTSTLTHTLTCTRAHLICQVAQTQAHSHTHTHMLMCTLDLSSCTDTSTLTHTLTCTRAHLICQVAQTQAHSHTTSHTHAHTNTQILHSAQAYTHFHAHAHAHTHIHHSAQTNTLTHTHTHTHTRPFTFRGTHLIAPALAPANQPGVERHLQTR